MDMEDDILVGYLLSGGSHIPMRTLRTSYTLTCYCFGRVKMLRHWTCPYHSVLLAASPASQQYFSLTPNQHQPPATSQPAVIFSHNNKPAPATSRTENILSLTTREKFPSSAKSPYLCFLIALFFYSLVGMCLKLIV